MHRDGRQLENNQYKEDIIGFTALIQSCQWNSISVHPCRTEGKRNYYLLTSEYDASAINYSESLSS